ncbi:MAG: histidine phosphatase family protein [Planctomycetota bacterium]
MAMKLIIIRHGETDYTAEKRYCGSAIDASLNNVGVKQAQKVRRLLQKETVDVVYTSPLIRTIQTTDIIFKNHPVKIYKTSLLRESNLGKWEGHTLSEIKKLFPEDIKKWYKDPLRYGATDGETPIILQRRVKRFLAKLSNTYNNNIGCSRRLATLCHRQTRLWRERTKIIPDGTSFIDARGVTIAIVTHSGPFRIIIGEISGNGLKDFWGYEPKTCEYKIVKFKSR